MKRILASILAVVLLATMAVSVFADTPSGKADVVKVEQPDPDEGGAEDNETLKGSEAPADETPADETPADEAPAEDVTVAQVLSDGTISVTVSSEDAEEGIVDLSNLEVVPGDVLIFDKAVDKVILDADANPGVVAITADGEILKTFPGSIIIYGVPAGVEITLVDNSKEFTDTAADEWYADVLAFATAREYILGNGDGTFAPDADLTDAALYATILRVLGKGTYTGEGWDEAAKADAAELGIAIDDVDGAVTREDAIAIISNAIGADAVEAGIFVGDENGDLNVEEALTRAQLATVAERIDNLLFNK